MKIIKKTLAQTTTLAALTLGSSVATAATVDLLVVYDDYSNQYFSGQVETAMRNWIAQVNGIYQNSQVDLQLRLVGMLAKNTAGSDMSAVLGNLRVDSAVAQKRDQVGADFVVQLHKTGACGVGYMAVDRNWAFNVVGPTCGAQTMAHELGHNMGLNHSRRQGDQSGARYRYGLGYGVDGSFATTMAYPSAFNANWVPRFSNPTQSCNGMPCGRPEGAADEADAAKALNNVKADLANFMPTRDGGTTTPASGVCMYEHSNYAGARYCVGEGTSNLPANWNDKVSSVKVQAGYKAEFFENYNLGGSGVAYTGDIAFVGAAFNDKASSIRVTKAGSCAGTPINGSFSGANFQTQTQPNGSYYYSSGSGSHTACFSGPANSDFDLFLDKWNGSAWAVVAVSEGPTSTENISYSGTSGYYRYRVINYSGTGAYTLIYNKP